MFLLTVHNRPVERILERLYCLVKTMQRLIINADDFGISHEVNDAVCEAFRRFMITGTTLMVNMPYADEAVELAGREGFNLRVGLHLNLTSGVPLTGKIRNFPCFCGKDGRFNASFQKNTASRLHLTKEETEAASEEIEAQLKKYLSYGLPLRHLDSHHHVHTDPSIYKPLEPLLKKYDFKSVRLSRNIYGKISFLKALYKRRYNFRLRRTGVFTSDYFGSYLDFKHCCDKMPENSLTEIMVHPMYSDSGELIDTKIPMQREKEFFNSVNAVYEFY